jgi:hypothetical protein
MLYIGNFTFSNVRKTEENGEEKEGSFLIILEAMNPEEAESLLRKKIKAAHKKEFLSGAVDIYLENIIEVEQGPGITTKPSLLNFEEHDVDMDRPSIRLSCAIPDNKSRNINIYDDDFVNKDGTVEPFISTIRGTDE